ncbi:MAG: Hsp20/alpha crystallin family protein [Planctomycetaceae bacterium]|nr:Hsp20/alpha crystallin family protein [Planctomycetaceae bacterium]
MNTTLANCQTDTNCCTEEASRCGQHENRAVRPKADIFQTVDGWVITLDVPGADESTTDISVEKDVLSMTATAEDLTPEGFDRAHAEFAPRKFERSFRLPDEVDRAAIEATVKNGVLQVTLPKSPETKPHQVVVKGG